ncbi:hypothetical protein F4860DRAFT_527723 [Xylaria cubensis]|nr:hypothetical protein F4860DRAFT_527723 [Xylaria cubensis]
MLVSTISLFPFFVLQSCLLDTAWGQALPPTLVYNCAKMPSICRNVHTRNPLLPVVGNPAVGNLGLLDPGQTPGGRTYIELTLTFINIGASDTNAANKDARRDLACPSNWYRNPANACPRPNQPPVVVSGSSYMSGYAGQRWVQNGVTFGQSGYNVIANRANNGPGGLFWSCDEWPPATINKPTTATTFTFKFQTTWKDNDDDPGAYVEYIDQAGGDFIETTFKRSNEIPHKSYALIYNNGSVMSYSRPMTEDEVLISFLPGSPTSTATLLPSSSLSLKSNRAKTRETDNSAVGSVFARQNTDQCSATKPCPDGSCCNNQGGCGYGPENCGAGNCTNNCGATAMCGRDSLHGNVSCPLNVCCSYYGYCGTGSEFCSSPHPNAPCQTGFGSCSVVNAPSCGGNSALGRSMAYYQVANSYSRQCERITPAQINTTGLTHLILAFVSIDPTTFEIVPVDSRDVPIYSQFTALKTANLQTWVSVGGWDFNDPGPTQSTFSDIAASASNRATFIASVKAFMNKYGFQGIDIDWDYWYLRWFDPIKMEPYVDYLNLLSYDLHGPWDSTVDDIGPVIIGQTNIPELYNWTLSLWYDKVDPSKINMGLAYYGRGYTVEDVDCTTVGCKWSGTSRPAPCTNFGGVMSLQELQAIVIPEVGVKPILDPNAMMKYLVWGDQWIGYDDLETIAMKKAWGSSHCFGGTMIWSIDLYSGAGSGNTPDGLGNATSGDPGGSGGNSGGQGEGSDSIVYIDPSIWGESEPVINCEPPCTFILPPLPLSKPSTVTFPPYSTGWTHTIETTTLTIPPLVITEIPVWHYTVSGTNTVTTVISTFYVTESIRPPPFTITDNPNPLSKTGVTHSPVTRTITPPPYPYSFTTPTSRPTTTTTSSTTGVAPVIFPIVTYKPGKPGPICKSHCGTPCFIFCHEPCLLDCTDGGNDFPDPVDPNPPPRPTPEEENDPTPTAKVTTAKPLPTDPVGDDPGDEDEEDEDDQCAFEFSLPAPTYVNPNFGASGTQTVSPPKPPPTSQPTANPTPPGPNPATESLHCYNSGASTDRGSMVDGVTSFCNYFNGRILDATDPNTDHTLTYTLNNIDVTGGTAAACVFSFGISGCWEYLTIQVTVINGCRFTIDGPSPTDDCGRIFREAIDKCDTSSTQYKQGGKVTSNCAVWNIDPNVDES